MRALLFAVLGVSLWSVDSSTGSAVRHVSLRAEDGWIIAADVYGEGARGLVLAHGGRLTKESWRLQAEELQRAGYHVAAIDLRGFGESRDPPASGVSDEARDLDVLAAIEYLRQHGAERISLIGASMGGDAAGDAAESGKGGSLDCLVLLSSAGGSHPERLRVRRLLSIASRDDHRSNGEPRLPAIQAGYEHAPQPKTALLLAGTAHGQALFETADGERVMSTILRFLSAPPS